MATKTLILRPHASICPDESLVTFFPNDITSDKAYTLVDDIEADDDATYILYAVGGSANFYFNYTKPKDLDVINSVTLYFKAKAEIAASGSVENLLCHGDMVFDDGTSFSDPGGQPINDAENYQLKTSNFSALAKDIVEFFTNNNQLTNFYVTESVPTANKNNPIRVTQLYIEIVYTATDNKNYIKTNNSWIELPATIYEKNNGIWVTSDLSKLTTKKYILKEVP